jgi:hypothetical protein
MKLNTYRALMFSLSAIVAPARVAAQAAVCPVSSSFAVYKVGSIAFEHPDNWVPYPVPRVGSIFGFDPIYMPGWRMGPSQDLEEHGPQVWSASPRSGSADSRGHWGRRLDAHADIPVRRIDDPYR